MICKLCGGRGSFFVQDGNIQRWWNCPACGGDGVTFHFLSAKPIKMKTRIKTAEKPDKDLMKRVTEGMEPKK